MSAHHWESEVIGRFEWDDLSAQRTIEVSGEVPMSLTGTRLPRRGNRYYPTMVTIALGYHDRDGEPITDTILPENARSLAAALLKAADLAESTDQPDSDACGHWWPCAGCKA
jgi:hypothetical protein